MKEFIEKLIGRLEKIYNRNDKAKKEAYEEQDWERFDLFTHRNDGVYTSISIVNQLAEEYKDKYVSKAVLEQVMWERDVAIEQLKELGYGFGEEVGWIPCSERLPENDDEVLCWYEYRIMQGTCEGKMKQTYGIGYYLSYHKTWGGEVSNGRDCRVIAWKPIKPYKEEAAQALKQMGE